MSKISHILLRNPVVVPTGTTLVEASKLMKKNKIASVLISKNGRLAGIISVEDIMDRVAAKADMDIEVDEVMHSPKGLTKNKVANFEKQTADKRR